MEFLQFQLEVRHANWPYLSQLFLAFLFFGVLGYFLIPDVFFLPYLILDAFVFLSLTQFHLHNIRSEYFKLMHYKTQAVQELISLLPLRAPLPPMTGWAATPELALNVMRTIQIEKPKQILEIGSGVTTVICAYSLEKFNPEGKILSVDHDKEYARKTENELDIHTLSSYAEIVHAPLTDMKVNGEPSIWYRLDFEEITEPVDLLIIDGPPLKTRPFARYPALPLLFDQLSENATIIMHDTDRNNESNTVQRWMKEFPDMVKTELQTEKGITIFKKRG